MSELCKDILQTLDRWRIPVDPLAIAKDEGIELAPGTYGDGFDARIEYLASVKRFVIYYRMPGPGRTEGRVRFSIAHELGHFYLPEHRQRLLRGKTHNSQADFRSQDPAEREADEFAASLLMPEGLFAAEVRRFRQHVCTLKELCQLADTRFGTSVTSTARRYCQCDMEPCSIVISANARVRWAMHSDEFQRRNMKYIQFGSPVPMTSRTGALWQKLSADGTSDPLEGAVDSDIWYERPFYRKRLWEEAMALGNTGLALTYLTLEDHDD